MRKGERLAIFIVAILISIAFLINAKLVKIGFDSFATAREAKKTEEAEKANRWGDEPKYDTKDPVDPDADPQGTNPDNADYGGGSNIHNDTKVSIESDYRKNSESDEGYLVDPEPVPAPEPPKKEYPESGHKETNPPKKEYGSKSKADESHEERGEKDPPLVESGTSQRSSVHEYTDEMLVVPE